MSIEVRRRRNQLAAIHVGASQLGMDDDTYRAMLERVSATCGQAQRSAAKMTAQQRQAVIDELRKMGASAPGDRGERSRGKPRNFNQLPLLITKIEALLTVQQLPWSYADGIAKQMFGVERVAWCKQPQQLRAVLSALHRRGALQEGRR